MRNIFEYYGDGTYLAHHGIDGMKWGKRNGPPYPLTYNKHSATEKRLNTKAELSGYTDSKEKKRKNRTTKKKTERKVSDIEKIEGLEAERVRKIAQNELQQKVTDFLHSKQFKNGMKIAVTAAALYGASQIGKHFLRKYAVNHCESIYDALPKNFKRLRDIPKAAINYHDNYFNNNGPDAYKELIDNINHGVDESNLLSDYFIGGGRNQNCTFCSAAIVMRLKGYDVTAAEIRTGLYHEITDKWFTNVEMMKPKTNSVKKLYNALLKQGDGAYGTLNVFWKGNQGGHALAYVVKNGKVEILDGQVGKSYGRSIAELEENLFVNCILNQTEIFNLTNCDPTEYILKAIM